MAENLGLQVEVGANIKPLTKGLADARKELSNTAAAAGQFGKSVGNLGQNFASFGSVTDSATSDLKDFTETLLTGGLVAGLTIAGAALLELGKRIFDATEAEKNLNEALEAGRSAYVKVALDINKVKDALEQAREGTITKERALKIYNKTLGDTLGHTNDFNEAEANTIKNGPKLLQYTILKAAANYALGKSAQAAAKAEAIRQSTPTGTLTLWEKFLGAIKGGNFISNWGEQWKDNIKDASKEEENWGLISEGLSEKAKKIADDIMLREEGTVDAIKRKTKAQEEYVKVVNRAATIKGLESGFDRTIARKTISPEIVLNPKISIDPGANKALEMAFASLFDQEAQERIAVLSANFATMVAQTIESTVENSIIGIADALGSALGGGKNVIPNLFGGLMNSVGQQIQELGKFLIKSAITVKIAKDAFNKLLANPIAAIAVGVGLIALGAILKAQASKQFQGFATGVRNFEGGVALVGERGPELVNLPRGSGVVPNNETMAYGGGGGGKVIAEYVMRGPDLVTVIRRAEAQMSRNG